MKSSSRYRSRIVHYFSSSLKTSSLLSILKHFLFYIVEFKGRKNTVTNLGNFSRQEYEVTSSGNGRSKTPGFYISLETFECRDLKYQRKQL
uniref:Ovule protein n=1 Tax=Romanomermis culicivorax TaxID=13658 RepID=A0A915L1R5_ROMCU